MYTPLGEAALKSGERMEIGVVRAPDAEWEPRVRPFLGHKSPDYRAHVERSLTGRLDDLETRFYVGSIDGRVISQIMIVGSRGTGILGHVYTYPDERRKGACAAIMAAQMEDCRQAGFQVLTLGTGFDSPPYWIYHSFGFRGIAEGSGRMKWLADPDAEERVWQPGVVTVRDLRWDDWSFFNLLGFLPVSPDEELPRSPTLGVKGQDTLEGRFVTFQLRRERESKVQAKALVAESGATVGWGLLAPDARWNGDVWLLDVFAHPSYGDRLPELIGALEFPAEPVAAYVAPPGGPKARALSGAGFSVVATLPGWMPYGDGRHDLRVWDHRP